MSDGYFDFINLVNALGFFLFFYIYTVTLKQFLNVHGLAGHISLQWGV